MELWRSEDPAWESMFLGARLKIWQPELHWRVAPALLHIRLKLMRRAFVGACLVKRGPHHGSANNMRSTNVRLVRIGYRWGNRLRAGNARRHRL